MKKNLMITLFTVCMLTNGCTTNFEEYNSNPYGVSDEILASGGEAEKMASDCEVLAGIVIPLQENLYQNAISLGCETLSGYMAQTKHTDIGKYNYNQGFIDYPFNDEQSLAKVIKQYNSLALSSNASHDNVFYAWGTVLKVAIMHRLTDMYGPIPYEFAGTEAQKPYQKQEYIYRKMIEELTWASQTLRTASLSNVEKNAWITQDDIYDGDLSKWVKYTNSLKLRLAMRTSGQLPNEARVWAEEAVKAGVIEANTDNALKPTTDNPFYKMSNNWGDTRCGADLIAYMNAFKDPRLPIYFEKTKRGGAYAYFGLRAGVEVPAKEDLVNDTRGLYSSPKVKMTDPIVWMTAAEVAFLKAEGALKNWNMGNTPEALYKMGIELSMNMYQVQPGNYLEQTGTRGTFIDTEYPRFNNADFSSSITVKWSTEKKHQLGQIITQKYIAMFPYGSAEAWAEWRRTGYPNLLPAIDYNLDVNNIQRDKDGADIRGYRRYPLPPSEYSGNNGYVVKAIADDLEGKDSPNTNVWWARKQQ